MCLRCLVKRRECAPSGILILCVARGMHKTRAWQAVSEYLSLRCVVRL